MRVLTRPIEHIGHDCGLIGFLVVSVHASISFRSNDKDVPQSDDDDGGYRRNPKAPLMMFSEYLSRRQFCGDFMNSYGSLPHQIRDGLSTLMLATQKNDLCMMNWLLDVGCDVNG